MLVCRHGDHLGPEMEAVFPGGKSLFLHCVTWSCGRRTDGELTQDWGNRRLQGIAPIPTRGWVVLELAV